VVTLIIVAVAFLDPFGEEAPFIEQPTTVPTTTTLTSPTSVPAGPSTTAAETTTTARPASAALGLAWGQVDGLGATGTQTIADIVAGGPGFVAVGADGPIDDSDAAVWYSADGRSWDRVLHEPEVFGGAGSQYMAAVAASDSGFVAVGYDWMSEVDGAAVWTSVDGLVWSRVTHNEDLFGGEGFPSMENVIPWSSGFLSVGTRSTGDDPNTAGIWTAADGSNWQRTPHDPEAFEGDSDLQIHSVVAFGTDVVAVGSEGPGVGAGGEGQPAVVWRSNDGLTWQRVSGWDPAFQSVHLGQGERRVGVDGDWATMRAVTVGGPGLVAVGEDGWCTASGGCRIEAAVWTSADGLTWQRQTAVEQVGRMTRMFDVVDLGHALVATGSSSDLNRNGPAVVWTSIDDGVTWVREPHDSEVFGSSDINQMVAAIRVGEDVIGAGILGSNGAVWIGTTQD
jgi:hypothetical protein